MVKEVEMTFDETVEYVRNNVYVGDVFEISYNRIFAPGEVLGLTEEDEVTGEGLVGLDILVCSHILVVIDGSDKPV